jgi:hypothetical protein
MAKLNKPCTHPDTVQTGDENEVRTYCRDCGELVKVVKNPPNKLRKIKK